MAAISPLVLKVLGGLSVAAVGVTGSYFVIDNVRNSISVFDQSLIDFLKKEKNDIIFEVKTGSNEAGATTELSDNFLNWSSDSQDEKRAVVKISVSTADKSKFKVNSSGTPSEAKDENINEILKSIDAEKYSGKSFTWTCSIKFSTKEKSKNLKDDYKNLVYKSNDGGLLGILKKDNSTDNNQHNKDKKIKFIKDCGTQRGLDKNRKLNKDRLTSNPPEIKSEIKFNLVDDGSNLKPENKELFKYWFGEK